MERVAGEQPLSTCRTSSTRTLRTALTLLEGRAFTFRSYAAGGARRRRVLIHGDIPEVKAKAPTNSLFRRGLPLLSLIQSQLEHVPQVRVLLLDADLGQ